MNQPLNRILIVKSLVSKYQDARKTAARAYEIKAEKWLLIGICIPIFLSVFIWTGYEKWISLLLIPIFIIVENVTHNWPQRFLARLIWGKKISRIQKITQEATKKELLLYKKHLILMAKRHQNWTEVYKQAAKIIDLSQ